MADSNTSVPLPSNFKIGSYVIKDIISLSDVAITYRALDSVSSPFVIKEYYPVSIVNRDEHFLLKAKNESLLSDYNDGVNLFKKTGFALNKIEYKSLINVREIISENNTAYIVMDFEEGISLKEILSKSKVLDFDDIKNIIFPILESLKRLHKERILHLAICPENILIRSDGTPVLIGLGSYYNRLMDEGAIVRVVNKAYAPIEQFTKQEDLIGNWTDIYSMGAVLYQCVSGNRPEDSLKRYESKQKIGTDPVDNATEIGKGKYTTQMLSAIDHSLSIKPHDRPKTVSEWTHEFLAVTRKSEDIEGTNEKEINNTTLTRAKKDEVLTEEEIVRNAENYLKLVRAYVGGKRQTYYMKVFYSQIDRNYFPSLSWNFPAFLFSVIWMFYRKMYVLTVILIPIISVIFIYIAFYLIQDYVKYDKYYLINPTIDYTAAAFVIFIMCFLGYFGNYFYYLHTRLKIYFIREKIPDVKTQRKILSKKGGVSVVMPFLALMLISTGTYFGYAHLQESNNTSKIQMNEAITILNVMSKKISSYRRMNQKWPSITSEIVSRPEILSYKYVGGISIMENLLVITFKEIGVHSDLKGKSIAIYGKESKSGKTIQWTCGSIDVPLAYLPVGCKINLK